MGHCRSRVEGQGRESLPCICLTTGRMVTRKDNPSESIMGLFKGADVVVILKVHIMLWDYSVIPLGIAFTQEQEVSRLLCRSHLFHVPRIDAICHKRCR